jgi:hypothetical protein
MYPAYGNGQISENIMGKLLKKDIHNTIRSKQNRKLSMKIDTYTGTNYHIFWSNQHPNNVKNKKLKLDKWEYLIFKSWVNGETPMCLFVPFRRKSRK